MGHLDLGLWEKTALPPYGTSLQSPAADMDEMKRPNDKTHYTP